MQDNSKPTLTRELKTHAQILGGCVAVFWGLEVVDTVLRGSLDRFGIVPRSLTGLRGILFAPFLHLGFSHVIANTIPFLILGWLVMLRRRSDFWIVSLVTMVVSGLGVWLTAPAGSVTVGASGLIFGYLGFLLLRGYFERSWSALFLAVVVGVVYGGLIWGVLPGQPGISWQGHLFGFIGGAIAAWLLSQSPEDVSPD
ncbi:peptidase S54 [Neosynechococcus sphagnicola sy1]|uniref:Peptidase S54 n=1 Tax=Neosynechococcus sphagnicola sy1 TaxID=1497020 RepID=A0A098TLU1_9CYAN|nr:rhomboid family intramembrane serine protease [Neosynechococcus sphagnicola]KGF73226.1 peptidase S54 [Neosynechococcus sphagnicola sy1]